MGVGESTVSTWRRTEVLPRADHAARIAELLGVSVEYLVTGKEHAEPETRETEREILKEMHALSDNELKTVLGLVRNLVDNRYDGSHQKQTAG